MLLNELDELKKSGHIPIRNIYYMLAYIFKAPIKGPLQNVDKEEFENVYDVFAGLLILYVGQLVRQGLYREYIDKCEDIPVVRGKINIPGTIRHQFSNRMLLSCEHDELSENILLNRILKTTIMILLRSNRVKAEYKDGLKRNLWRFSNVSTIEYAAIPWSSIRFHQNNQLYHFLINICHFIMREMLLTTDPGRIRMERIDDDWKISSLYERFVFAYYTREFEKLGVTTSRMKVEWDTSVKDKDKLPKMITDITLTYGNKILIIDTKYYSHNTYTRAQYYYDDKEPKHKIHSSNLYQIFAYVKNKQEEVNRKYEELKRKYEKLNRKYEKPPCKISGMLLYARTDEPETWQPDNEFEISDNKFYVKTLDLDCEFENIKKQLNAIAEKIIEVKNG